MPAWPIKMTRDERKFTQQRRKDFELALKARVKGTGWRYNGGAFFRQDANWFLSSNPSLTWKRGINLTLTVKLMALDRLFWDIVGLEQNNELPLSFRQNGAWVLRPPQLREFQDPDFIEPSDLADFAFEWAERWRVENLPAYNLDAALAAVGQLKNTSGQNRAVAICLLILTGNFSQAQSLCEDNADDAGSFSIGITDNFYILAKRWLAINSPT